MSHRVLKPPHQEESRLALRDEVEQDLRELEQALRGGSTLYLTPEGRMTESGAMGRFRAALDRLLPASKKVMLAASAYDPWVARRLALYVSLEPLTDRRSLRDQLSARRPITLSQLLSRYLLEHPHGGSVTELVATVRTWVEGLAEAPLTAEAARVVPDVFGALSRLERRGVVRLMEGRWIPGPTRFDARFQHVPDIVQAQARQLSDTLDACWRLRLPPIQTGARTRVGGGEDRGQQRLTGEPPYNRDSRDIDDSPGRSRWRRTTGRR